MQAAFNKLIEEIRVIKFLAHTPIDVNSYKHPGSGKFLKEEYFERYNVNVTDNADVFPNKQYVKEKDRTKIGGAGAAASDETKDAYIVKFHGPRLT